MILMNLATAMLMTTIVFAPLGAASAQTTNSASPQESANPKVHLTTIGVNYGARGIGARFATLFQNADGQEKRFDLLLGEDMTSELLLYEGINMASQTGGTVVVFWDLRGSPESFFSLFRLPCAVFQSDYSTNELTAQATVALRQSPRRQQFREAMLKFQEWAATARREHVTSLNKLLPMDIEFIVDKKGNASFKGPTGQEGMIDSEFYLFLLDSRVLENAASYMAKNRREEIAKQNLFK